ncbi:MAG: cytochrome C oxidase subunit IV family protein [Bryobacteraceae bacterium]|nr:cytochrome C oxidase subunit IV family protein [Bryobacteraceae bacterium]
MDAHAHAHHPGAKTYVAVLGGLLFLTIVTVLAAGVNWGSPAINVVIALFIATIKASLVALFFMHLLYDRGVNALILLTGLLFLGVFLSFCLIDVGARNRITPSYLKVQTPAPAPASTAVPAAAPAAAPAKPAH